MATLSVTPTQGAVGSFFQVTGTNFFPNQPVSLFINGHLLTDTMIADATGGINFQLDAAAADVGYYMVMAEYGVRRVVQIEVNNAAPVIASNGNTPIFAIPAGMGYTDQVFLPYLSESSQP
jgi:hypothetical protein